MNSSNTITIPIKKILTNQIQIEEFEFIRNNPMVSTLGAAALGGAIVHDYHKNGYNSVGKYIGDKIDTTKEAIGSGVDSVKKGLNNLTKDNGHKDNSFQQDNVMNHNTLNTDV